VWGGGNANRGRLHVEPTRHPAVDHLSLSPSLVSLHLQDDRPKCRGNSRGSSGMREASSSRTTACLSLGDHAVEVHRAPRAKVGQLTVTRYAEEEIERENKTERGAEDSGDLEHLPSRSSNKIRFKIQCVTCTVHEPLRRSTVTQSEFVAPCKM